MAVVISALSIADFSLFKTFIDKIDLQQGPKNSVRYVKESVKTKMYSLIQRSFGIARELQLSKASRNAPLKISEIASDFEYLIVDENADFVAGTTKHMTSYKGIPAVERALKEGIASDGTIRVDDQLYLIGVVPVMKQISKNGPQKLFAIISLEKLILAFKDDVFPMPVRVYRGDKFISETKPEVWKEIEKGCGAQKLESSLSELIKTEGNKVLNNWSYLYSFFMPVDMLGGDKIVFVTLSSSMPGLENYSNVIFYTAIYTLIAIIMAFFFTFIVTHEIDKVFRNLAADISRMKVGEKLVLKKYSHGADIAVSALNTLIAKYLRGIERDGSAIGQGMSRSPSPDVNSNNINREFDAEIPDPFGVDDIEETPRKPIPALPSEKKSPKKAPPPSTDDDDEKTQLVTAPVLPDMQSISEEPEQKDPFDVLWEDYCRIKEDNGKKVSESEKRSFIGKLRTNRASIMAKYNCSDVSFTIEDKGGKPVIKAKPVNG
jgi:hypothetical protein